MKIAFIFILLLSISCKKTQSSPSVEPPTKDKEDTLIYPSALKPCIEKPEFQKSKYIYDLESCSNIDHKNLFGSIDYPRQQYAFINGTSVNVRKGPGKEYEKLGTLEITYRVELFAHEMDSQNAKWYFLSFDGFSVANELDPVLGWVNSEYVSMLSDFKLVTKINPGKIEFQGVDGAYEYTFKSNGTCIDTYHTKEEYGGITSRDGKIFRHKDLIWCREKSESDISILFDIREGKYRPEFRYRGLD